MRRLGGIAVLVAAMLVPASTAGASTCADASLTLTAASAPKVEAALRCLVNEERAKRGRKALKSDAKLNALADAHNSDMSKRHYFSHVTPGGKSAKQRVKDGGYKGTYVAENIGTGGTSAEAMMAVWMKSTQHRTNILSSKATRIGAGALAADGRTLYTLIFGRA